MMIFFLFQELPNILEPCLSVVSNRFKVPLLVIVSMNIGVFLIYRRRRQKIQRVSHLTNDKEGFVLAKTLGLMILVLGRDLRA